MAGRVAGNWLGNSRRRDFVSAACRNILFLTEANQDNEGFSSLGKLESSFPWLACLGIFVCVGADLCHPRNPWLRQIPNIPRNLAPDFTHYLSERPEMTFHGGKPRKTKTIKGN
jgi:hypothetical protein